MARRSKKAATRRLEAVQTVVIVMMENRSFDHLVGYLSLPGGPLPSMEGLRDDPVWRDRYRNPLTTEDGTTVQDLFPLGGARLEGDPPHDRESIALQMGRHPAAAGPMTGFVQTYLNRGEAASWEDLKRVMGYYTAAEAPVLDFFARNYAICDQWFAAIPTGTQPNRLMAMSGTTRLDDNKGTHLPPQDLVYDWLDGRKVSWCVYAGVPFFLLMESWRGRILKDLADNDAGKPTRFRRFRHLARDVKEGTHLPQVIFIEPVYTDVPIPLPPNDDHPPTPIEPGQRFLELIYRAFAANRALWRGTVMIVTYDEHGGIFDHVQPRRIPTQPPKDALFKQPFDTTGVRVPAFIVSPLVEPVVCKIPLDHTSVLHFLAERFGPGSYSPEVEARLQGPEPLGHLSEAITRKRPRAKTPVLPPLGFPHERKDDTPNVAAFRRALRESHRRHRAVARRALPELWWTGIAGGLRGAKPAPAGRRKRRR